MTAPPTIVGRASYREIELYAPDRAPCRIDLSDNTNLWGMPPAAARALAGIETTNVSRYPRLYADRLKNSLARYLDLDPRMVATGCGSDDVLDSAIRAFAEPGERIAYPDPTFPMIPLFARMNGLIPEPVAMTPAHDVDVDGILAIDARIIYLCSPNNPTGAALRRESIAAVVAGARPEQVVIVDEAYAEYAGTRAVDLLVASDRLLVTRTMSKAFGLAGLRIGYAAGSPALIAEVEKSRGPYKVNALAEHAAVAALDEGMDWVREHVALAIENRQRLELQFLRRGLSPIASAANFILLPIADAVPIARRMRELGVAVRAFDGLPGISDELAKSGGSALRLTVGPWPMLAEAIAIFDQARR
jgi:histidinol-phosphate aminotransferase